MEPLPGQAAWRRTGDQQGFEVVLLEATSVGGTVARGRIAGLDESGSLVPISYRIEIDASGATRRATVEGLIDHDLRTIEILGDGAGGWTVDGKPRPELDGCFDVDLSASAFTNTLPIRRLGLGVGDEAAAPAVYVQAGGLVVSRLEQTYLRRPDDPPGPTLQRVESRYAYSAPAFEFAVEITYDASGLVVDYPWIGSRADLAHEDPAAADGD